MPSVPVLLVSPSPHKGQPPSLSYGCSPVAGSLLPSLLPAAWELLASLGGCKSPSDRGTLFQATATRLESLFRFTLIGNTLFSLESRKGGGVSMRPPSPQLA